MRRVYAGLLVSVVFLALLTAGNRSVVQAQETPPQATSVIYLPLVAAPPRVEVTLFTEEDNGNRNVVTSLSLLYGVRRLGMAAQVAGAG
nr:hypothetical protein [Chloroflexaceae bacterium]